MHLSVFPIYIKVKDQKSVSKHEMIFVDLHKNSLSDINKNDIDMATQAKLEYTLDVSLHPMLNNDRKKEDYKDKYS